ncbi:Phosphodiesterase MJ0936/Vps29 [Carpediemonas membranifera]|uniref:Vacuolar protein sorting-associated protein 29 n=1 Tax=Carpediemonas membranifera TaxID=201153 RepID=A0A8J6B028_9EUKA|nr:Phosphodiesterase MJ0936/Vps29 [Carpediemonas membranifera]|eukprot:KAG9390044.1 Phosphodiesterase MJ0936/Vps29 [Carpediemonas membranifera]
MLVLCIGDLHIPSKAIKLPEAFKKPLSPGKLHHVISTGNLTNLATHDMLRDLASNNLLGVAGEFDDLEFPSKLVENLGGIRVGITHGHRVIPRGNIDALAALTRRWDVDILVVGGMPEFAIHQIDGRFIICPGSATGIAMPPYTAARPSFAVLDLQLDRFGVYHYSVDDSGALSVNKESYLLHEEEEEDKEGQLAEGEERMLEDEEDDDDDEANL